MTHETCTLKGKVWANEDTENSKLYTIMIEKYN